VSIKIEALVGNVERPFKYGNVFSRENVGGREPLKIGLNDRQDAGVLALMEGLGEFACAARQVIRVLWALLA
jgi:hypothetical protein